MLVYLCVLPLGQCIWNCVPTFNSSDSLPGEERLLTYTRIMEQTSKELNGRSRSYSSYISLQKPEIPSRTISRLHPPRAPHFGGLWEAGVRSMKTLLQKLITPHHLRFDELYTIVTEVEAVLNSRPILPLSSTNIDDTTLTPGHILIGRPLKSPPYVEAEKTKISSLCRWALVNRLSQDLWKAWIGCYL